jgi:hypothetical protein
MKYDLSKHLDINKATAKFTKLIEQGKCIELTEKRKVRSIQQNSYIHIVFTLYGICNGLTIEEAKTDLKRDYPNGRYEKNGNTYLVQTSKMNTKELSDFVEWILEKSAKEGNYIPTSEDYLESKFEIDRQIEAQKQYL